MKFKVGDKVVVKKDLKIGETYNSKELGNSDSVVYQMVEFAGKEVTISSITSANKYRVAECSGWNFVDTMFEEIKKFKVGDIVTGTELAIEEYSITTDKGTFKVLDIHDEDDYGDTMKIECVSHKESTVYIGHTYDVNDKYFKIVEEVVAVKFEVGDIVTGNSKSGIYGYTTKAMTRGKVTKLFDDGDIMVEILEQEKYPNQIGREYRVESARFNLVEKAKVEVPVVEPITPVVEEPVLMVKDALGATFFKIGRYTICVEGAFGVSLRHPDDRDVEEIGESLAFKRMVEHEKF